MIRSAVIGVSVCLGLGLGAQDVRSFKELSRGAPGCPRINDASVGAHRASDARPLKDAATDVERKIGMLEKLMSIWEDELCQPARASLLSAREVPPARVLREQGGTYLRRSSAFLQYAASSSSLCFSANSSSFRYRVVGSTPHVHQTFSWHSGQNSSGRLSLSGRLFEPFMPHS